MAEISKITLPSGSTYDIKDAQARIDIANIQTIIEGITGGDAIVFVGVSTTAITDGGTEQPTVDGTTLTPGAGQLFFYGTQEFIWGKDNKWHELGSLDALGALAYKDAATTQYTPNGTISTPVFTGSETTSMGKFTPTGSVTVTTNTTANKTATVSSTTGTATYTPSGSVAAPTFTGTAATISSSASYQPAGSVSLTDSNKTATVSAAASGTTTYTPAGSVAAPTISVDTAGTTTSIKNPTSVTVAKTVVAAAPGATAPANSLTYYSVSDETLSLYQLGYTTGDSITTANVTVKTGDASYTASAPDFIGTAVRLVTSNIAVPTSASFTGTQATISSTGSYTPEGTNSAPDFTGDGVRLVTDNIPVPDTYTTSFTGTEGDVMVSGTAAGTISKPLFTGTLATIRVQ